VAEARGWQGLRLSGSEDFKRHAWVEASLRGIKSLGYEAQLADMELLRRERDARMRNQIAPAPGGDRASSQEACATARRGSPAESATKASVRGGSRKTVLAALEAVLLAQGVPAKRREAVMAAAEDRLTARLVAGEVVKVRTPDPAAPTQRTSVVISREVAQPSREQMVHVR